jgi:hypothetical protein
MIWFFAGAIAVLAAGAATYRFWERRVRAQIRDGCEIEWERLSRQEPELLEGLDRARFDAVCQRVRFPRFPGYALAASTAFLAALPVVFGLLATGLYGAERLGLLPAPAEVADRYLVEEGRMRIITAAPPEAAAYWLKDVAGFYYFFGVGLAWIAIVWIFARRYHARRPGRLREELLSARAKET